MSPLAATHGPLGPRAEARSNRIRAALWSTYFHRFYNHWSSRSDQAGPTDQIPRRYRPLSPNEAMRALNDEARSGDGVPRSVLRGAAAQVLWSRYQLDPHGERALWELVEAAETAPAADGLARMRARGDAFQRARPVAGPGPAHDDRTRIALAASAPSDDLCVVDYLEVRSTGTLTILSYQVVLDRPLADVAAIIDPRSWAVASPAFLEVRLLEPAQDPGPPGVVCWSGRYFEHVVMNWNLFTLSSFEATLKVDVDIEPFQARTDYSLVRERGWQLANDYGFVRARKQAGRPGRTVVTAEKCVTFRSPWMNFMCPATLSMSAGQWVETLRDFVERSAPVGAAVA